MICPNNRSELKFAVGDFFCPQLPENDTALIWLCAARQSEHRGSTKASSLYLIEPIPTGLTKERLIITKEQNADWAVCFENDERLDAEYHIGEGWSIGTSLNLNTNVFLSGMNESKLNIGWYTLSLFLPHPTPLVKQDPTVYVGEIHLSVSVAAIP